MAITEHMHPTVSSFEITLALNFPPIFVSPRLLNNPNSLTSFLFLILHRCFARRYAPTAQVSFRGVIVSRELRQSDTPSQRLPNGLVEVPKFGPMKASLIKDLQLSFALLTNNIIQLRVRDLQSPNTISVYLDLRRTDYICGLLPG